MDSGPKIHTRMSRAVKWAPTRYNKPSVHFSFSKNHNISTYSIDLLKGKCTEGLLYHVGAHLKAGCILVWILGPESITATVLLCQSWLQCETIPRPITITLRNRGIWLKCRKDFLSLVSYRSAIWLFRRRFAAQMETSLSHSGISLVYYLSKCSLLTCTPNLD